MLFQQVYHVLLADVSFIWEIV